MIRVLGYLFIDLNLYNIGKYYKGFNVGMVVDILNDNDMKEKSRIIIV